MQKAFIISSFLYSHSNDKDEASSIKMSKLLNQDSYKHICFSCCPCVPPAVYVALIIEGLLLGWYHPQELRMYPLFPRLRISLINDVKQCIICLCASTHSSSPPHTYHSYHPQCFDLLPSLARAIKRRARCRPHIDGRSSANANPSNETEDFTANQKVLIETLQPFSYSSSPSAPLDICDSIKGILFLISAGTLISKHMCSVHSFKSMTS